MRDQLFLSTVMNNYNIQEDMYVIASSMSEAIDILKENIKNNSEIMDIRLINRLVFTEKDRVPKKDKG